MNDLTCLNICRITFWSNLSCFSVSSMDSLNICRITFWSNYGRHRTFATLFEYMSYYLLVKLYV